MKGVAVGDDNALLGMKQQRSCEFAGWVESLEGNRRSLRNARNAFNA